MIGFAARRVGWTLLVLLCVSAIVSGSIRLIPGDPVDMMYQTDAGSSQQREALRRELGLDLPWVMQYLSWMGSVLQGDMGRSLRTGRSISSDILAALPVTLQLVALGILIGSLIGVSLGVLAAKARGRFLDWIVQPLALVGLSLPSFWSGSLLLIGAGLYFPGFKAVGYVPFLQDPLKNISIMALPSFALGIALAAAVMRMTRTAVLDVMQQDYVRTARAKGLSETVVLNRHILVNALIPVVTMIGIQAGVLIGGSIVLERVFALPGLGRLLVTAITERDYLMVQGITLVIAALFVIINLVTDLLYGLLDPRIKVS